MAAPDDLRLTDYDLKPVTRNPKLAILDFRLGTRNEWILLYTITHFLRTKVYPIVFGHSSRMDSVNCLPYIIFVGNQRIISGHQLNTTRAIAIIITYGTTP